MKMSDYISRKAAIEAIQPKNAPAINFVLARMIESVPAADVIPVVRGEWRNYGENCLVCSACNKYFIARGDQYDFRFCPNCGADMRNDA